MSSVNYSLKLLSEIMMELLGGYLRTHRIASRSVRTPYCLKVNTLNHLNSREMSPTSNKIRLAHASEPETTKIN